MWIYNLNTGVWTFIKVGTNMDIALYPRIPEARYGHSGSYVELDDPTTFQPGTN